LGFREACGGFRAATTRTSGSFICHTLSRSTRTQTPSGQFQEQIGEQ